MITGSALGGFGKFFKDSSNIIISIIVAILLLGIAFGIDCLIVWWAQYLWNGCLIAAIPMLEEVGFWQMWGIYLLSSFLVKSSTTINKE
jgi:hypothetical protein